MTLEKYFSKVQVIEKANGVRELKVYPDTVINSIELPSVISIGEQKSGEIQEGKEQIPNPVIKNLGTDSKKDPRQQSKLVCLYMEPCSDKEDQMCYFRGKWCSQQAKVVSQ